jgi:hypothetical protein
VAFWQQVCQFGQHGPSQVVLAVKVQPVSGVSVPVELAYLLLPLIQPGIEQKSDRANLDMHFHVHIPIGVDLFLARAFGVIMMKIYRLQMAGGFALFSQTVVNPDQDYQFDP